MDDTIVISALGALAQPTRLQCFRFLISREPEPVPAGELARELGVPQNTMSAHLSVMTNAGLLTWERQGRSILYRADLEVFRRLVLYLLQDCCGGNAGLCAPLISDLSTGCRPSSSPSPSNPLTKGPNMTDQVYNVLFLCTGNSARSIMAESILNAEAAGRFRAWSAGSRPKGAVHPLALGTLAALGYPSEGFSSKSWDVFSGPAAPHFDFIITLCDSAAGEACPIARGAAKRAHWGIEDPASVEGTDAQKALAFRQAAQFLKSRILAFISLPVENLEKMALESRLKQIGGLDGATDLAGKGV